MFSKSVKGTYPNKLKMNWWEYWIGHCWMTGWQTIRMSFCNWRDLMTGNYEGYALMFYDDPSEECVNWFWGTLGDDDTLPKEFLEGLLVQVAQIESGEVKPVPFKNIDDLLDDLKNEDLV